MDHIEVLRRLAISDARILDELVCAAPDDRDAPEPDCALDPRTLALVRLATLVAVGGAVSPYGAQADAAVDAGASAAEMVDVLVGVVPVVGIPCVAVPVAISTPSKVDAGIGTLEFTDGHPTIEPRRGTQPRGVPTTASPRFCATDAGHHAGRLSSPRIRLDDVAPGNWTPDRRDKGWFVFLSLYSPLESFLDKSWRTGEIEPVA